jgi:hypothetical protein
MPLGQIIDQNSNTAANDTWALVTSGIVVNTIVANLASVQAIAANYDYSVDLTIQGQSAGIGWTYTSATDTFAAPPPPPTNWIQVVELDFDQVCADLQQTLSDAANLDPTDLATAYANALNDSESGFTTNQLTLMNAIYSYILGGG